MRSILFAAVLLLAGCASANGQEAQFDGATMRLSITTNEFGAADALVRFEQDGRALTARSVSDVAPLIFTLERDSSGAFAGALHGPDFTSPVRLTLADGGVTGDIASGPLAGAITGAPYTGAAPLRDYPAAIAAMDQVLPSVIFNPHALETADYQRFHAAIVTAASAARDDLDLLLSFRQAWPHSAFSHFGLTRASSGDIASAVDTGATAAAELRFDGDIAVLRINTFLGQRAIEQIETAISETSSRNARALIVDLRATPGGSLAAKNLIEGLIAEPMPMGSFIGAAWWRAHNAAPSDADIAARPADSFADPQAAFQRLMTDGLLPVEVRPAATRYAGPVYVLIDGQTQSVAELAAATLGGSGRATLVGERTAGELLTADTIPLSDGFLLMTPLADYWDARLGRVEGVGVAPNIEAPSAHALDRALALARAR